MSLSDLGIEPRPEEEGLERHGGFAGNALAKARHFHRRTGLPALADDSGLCVDALEGAPGVRSRRFAPGAAVRGAEQDAANNAFLLERLAGVPPERRTAHYACALALCSPRGTAVVSGRVDGTIATAARGDGGFGYDPLFVPAGEHRTYAELPPSFKRVTSHRADAVRRLKRWIGSDEPWWVGAPEPDATPAARRERDERPGRGDSTGPG